MPTPPGDSHDAKATDPAAGHISFAVFIAGIRSGVAQMSVRTGAAVVALPLASVAYFAVPFSVTGRYCPPTTFLSQPMGLAGPFVVGLFLGMACSMVLIAYFGAKIPPTHQSPKLLAIRASNWFSVVGLIAPLCGLCISGLLWVDFTGSFYCATLDRALLHPSLYGPWRSLTWDDVTVVQASCRRTMSRGTRDYTLASTLRVSFADGEQIVSGWSAGELFRTMSYDGIRAALAHKAYRYITDHLSPDLCPPDVYPLLLNWQN